MARTNEHGKKLSWVKAVGQWRKRHQGKTYYLGTGRGITDRDSYTAALAKWDQIKAGLDGAEAAAARAADMVQERERWVEFGRRQAAAGATHRGSVATVVYPAEDAAPGPRGPTMTLGPVAETATATAKGQTVGGLLDLFLADQQRRYERGLVAPDAPRREKIGAAQLTSIRENSKLLRDAFGAEVFGGTDADAGRLMKRWRDQAETLLHEKKITANTFNHRVKLGRQFVGWMHRNYHIDSLPRDVQALASQYKYTSSAMAWDVPTIKRIWAKSDTRMRCWIALALNCGFYAVDVATMKPEHLKSGYIERLRNKSGVPCRFKLWSVTQKLIAECREKSGELLFLGEKGKPLVWYDMATNIRMDAIRCRLFRVTHPLKVKGSFSNFRDTTATAIEKIDPTLTDTFLGHADRRMAVKYIDPAKLDTAKLDAAIDQLEKLFGLKL